MGYFIFCIFRSVRVDYITYNPLLYNVLLIEGKGLKDEGASGVGVTIFENHVLFTRRGLCGLDKGQKPRRHHA